MPKRFKLDSAEEHYWKIFTKYNRVKYIFIFFIGFFSGIILLSFLYLMG